MDYIRNLGKAASRHYLAADELFKGIHRKDVAGYLYGLAAECAIKQIMLRSGMMPLSGENKREDPFWAHFERLKTLLRDRVSGRRESELRQFAENGSFMQYWDITMRYSDGRDVRPEWVENWRNGARDAIRIMSS